MKNLFQIFAILFNLFISFIATSTKHTSTSPEKMLFDLKYLVCSAHASTSKEAKLLPKSRLYETQIHEHIKIKHHYEQTLKAQKKTNKKKVERS